MSNYKSHAMAEFRAAGWTEDGVTFKDEMQGMICAHVLDLLDVFEGEGHSGSSAPYAIDLFSKLAKFEPIAALTGEDWEWVRHDYGDTPVYQNKRFSAVFKQADRFNGQAYWLDGKIFWSWASYPDIDGGQPFKSYYSGSESRVPIEFPWVKPEPQYVFVATEEFPNEVLDD